LQRNDKAFCFVVCFDVDYTITKTDNTTNANDMKVDTAKRAAELTLVPVDDNDTICTVFPLASC